MTGVLGNVSGGFYAQKQIHSPSRLISWSHRGRFQMALSLAREYRAERLLDYGCGDGTFLALLTREGDSPGDAVGAELHTSIVEDCRARLSDQQGLSFVLIADLDRSPRSAFDSIFCMEVLEHVIDPGSLLDRFHAWLNPGGTLVISVPIETGLPLVAKQMVRRIAGWRGIGHYPGTTGYTPIELVRSVCAGATQHLARPVFTNSEGMPFHDHKGFNWRVLRTLVRERFDLVDEVSSPWRRLGPQLGTQRWFIARKRR